MEDCAPVSTAVRTIIERHHHAIGCSLPDDRPALRTWRTQLQACLQNQYNRIIKCLLIDASGDSVQKCCQDIIAKYSDPNLSFTAAISDVKTPTYFQEVDAEISAELGGLTPAHFRDLQKDVVRLYVEAATATCAAEERLEAKLQRINDISAKVRGLTDMESTPELSNLGASIQVYIDSVMNKLDIQSDYEELMRNSTKFAALKNLVSLQNIQRSAAPTCTICMTKEVSHVVAPCGHTFCQDCCRTQITSCYICRVQIRDRMRLYFS